MAKEQFKDIKYRPETLAKLDKAREIITEFRQQEYRLTLRQLYYQFVVRGWIENSLREYKSLGKVLSNGRQTGDIDWDDIEDRTRSVKGLGLHGHDPDPNDFMNDLGCGSIASGSYSVDLWAKSQSWFPEIWVEKNAAIGVVERVANQWEVPYFAGVGYNSITQQKKAAERFSRLIDSGIRPVVFYLGDHDPSGLDIDRNYRATLGLFTGYNIDFRRVGLTFDQVQEFEPPPNPAKITDTRACDYIAQYGEESWELDALRPQQVHRIINAAIEAELDQDAWDKAKALVAAKAKEVSVAAEIINEAARKAAVAAAKYITKIEPLAEIAKRPAGIDFSPWVRPAPPPAPDVKAELEKLGLIKPKPPLDDRRF